MLRPPMLAVAGLHAYYGRAHILADVALEIARGEVVALLGRNGAGKSTTMKSIMGLVRPAKGRVTFEGRDITAAAPHAIARRGLGYVPEERRIFVDLTVMENLESAARRRARMPRPGRPSACSRSSPISRRCAAGRGAACRAASSRC